MNQEPEKIFKELHTIRMSASEKARIRIQVQGGHGRWVRFVLRHRAVIGLVALALLVGTTSTFANGTLPGDTLYPVRTAVNERVQRLLIFDDEARFNKEMSQLERSIDDEEQVAMQELAE